MLTLAFWKATAERAVRTGAQVLIGSLGLDQLGLVEARWTEGLALAGGAAVLTVLTALATPNGPGLTESVKTE
ncbi:holin [Streptomyces sp. NPDC052225]|uniref:holin n=1 Tax=Streptomyces sp. NPDC052225 TaxID=3154949 RepID=UPI003430805F